MELHFLKTTWSDIIILKKGNTVAMIDTGFEEQYNSIKKYLDKMNIKKIKFILLTHFHRDHYGSISSIVKDYDVDKVYFKDINSIQFDKYKLKLYNNKNFIKKIYNDENYKDSYHKILFSENQNSLAVFFRVNNVNIFFGGDIFDRESIHPSANYVNYQIASSINEEINIYKVPHHGTIHCNSKKALDIYRPKIAVITNSEEYLKKESTVYQDLMRANKNVKILLTEKNNIVIKISDEGHISYEKS